MKRNSFAMIALALGLVAALAGLTLPIIVVERSGAAGGVIGGANAPTYEFLLFNFLHGLPLLLVLLGVALVVTGLFCLILCKTVMTHCHRGTSLIALSLSAVGAVGLMCALECFTILALSSPKRYPIAYPLSVGGGLAALLFFFALIGLYFWQRSKYWSIKGVVIDILTSILYLPVFFWAFAYLLAFVR